MTRAIDMALLQRLEDELPDVVDVEPDLLWYDTILDCLADEHNDIHIGSICLLVALDLILFGW